MRRIIAIFGEMLADAHAKNEWDGICLFCGHEKYTGLAHNISASKANYDIFGTMIDMPIVNVIPSCRECNSGHHRGYARRVQYTPAVVIRIARAAWDQYYSQCMKNPKIISRIIRP